LIPPGSAAASTARPLSPASVQGDRGGGGQSVIAEEFSAKQAGGGLLAARAGAHGDAAIPLKAFQRRARMGGGLAQGDRVARSARQLQPDTGGSEAGGGDILAADPAGGDIGGLGLGPQQRQIKQFEQGAIAARQTVALEFERTLT